MGSLRDVWDWWIAELAGLAEAAGAAGGAVLTACPDGDGLVLSRAKDGRSLARLDQGESPGLLRSLRGRPVKLVLPAGVALRRAVPLPAAAAGRLGEVLPFEIERHTPFAVDQVMWCGRVEGRSNDGRTVTAGLTVVPRARVQPLIRLLAQAGLPLAGVSVARDGGKPDALPAAQWRDDHSASAGGGRGYRARLAWGVLAMLAVAALLSPILRLEASLAEERSRIADLRNRLAGLPTPPPEAVLADEVSRRYRAVPSATVLLERLTRRIPDDVWLSSLTIEGGSVALRGYAASAAPLVTVLESAPFIAAARFEGPIVSDPGTRYEQFGLALSLRETAP